jgi:hypothetical protein
MPQPLSNRPDPISKERFPIARGVQLGSELYNACILARMMARGGPWSRLVPHTRDPMTPEQIALIARLARLDRVRRSAVQKLTILNASGVPGRKTTTVDITTRPIDSIRDLYEHVARIRRIRNVGPFRLTMRGRVLGQGPLPLDSLLIEALEGHFTVYMVHAPGPGWFYDPKTRTGRLAVPTPQQRARFFRAERARAGASGR